MTEYQGQIIHHSQRPQMVFQDPYSSLNPAFTIRRIVEEPLRIYGKHPRRNAGNGQRRCLEAVGLGPEFHDPQARPALRRAASAGVHRCGHDRPPEAGHSG